MIKRIDGSRIYNIPIGLHYFQSLEKSCQGEYTNIAPNNTKCLKVFQEYEKVRKLWNHIHYFKNPPTICSFFMPPSM